VPEDEGERVVELAARGLYHRKKRELMTMKIRAMGLAAAVILCAVSSGSAQAHPPRMSMGYGSKATRWRTEYANAGMLTL
jgi:hypothetical protein